MSGLHVRWQVALDREHVVEIHRRCGFLSDPVIIRVDGAVVHTMRAGGFRHPAGRFALSLDGRALELRRLWSFWTGGPRAFALLDGTRILGTYGEAERLVSVSVDQLHQRAAQTAPPRREQAQVGRRFLRCGRCFCRVGVLGRGDRLVEV